MFLMQNKAGNAFVEASTESMKKELEKRGFFEVEAPKDKAPKDKAPKDKAPKDKAPKDKALKD